MASICFGELCNLIYWLLTRLQDFPVLPTGNTQFLLPCRKAATRAEFRVLQAKSLGVYLDENLSWNIQINELTKKIASGIVRSFVPVATLQLIFNYLVQPYFNYCSTVWENCNKTLAEKLQKLQNRAARVLTFSSYDTNADVLIEKLGWKKLLSIK